MISPGEGKTIHLRDYLDVIKRRRLPILSVFVVIVALVSTYTMLATKYYTATTQLLIEQTAQRSLSLQEALAVDSSAMDFYQTQYRLIESRAIGTKVVTDLKLYKLREFGAVNPGDLEEGEKLPTEEEAIRTAVGVFSKKLKVSPIRQSRLADISFTSKDPALAAKVADATAQAYINYVLDRKLAISQMAVKFLSRRIEEQRRKLQASQFALQKYMEENRLATVISENYNDIITQKLADLNQQLVEAETARKEAEARYHQALKARKGQSQFEGIKEFMDSPVIQKVRERELELSKREAELSQKYGARHPKMAALNAEKAALEREKRGEISQIINSQESQLTIASARENAIRQALSQQRQQAMDIRKKGIGFSVIKREVDTNQQLYDMLLTKVKEARVTEEIDVGMVTVVDKAQVPQVPSRPRVRLNILLAVVGGLLVALFWGFLLEYMDNTIKLPSQVEEQLGLPLLGSIPFDSSLFQGKNRKKAGASSLLEVIADPKSVTIEPLRMVRASISLSKAGTPPKSLVVSSTAPMEGKSVISSFLAVAFAEAGKKTLIIDGDMRKPRQHRIWGLTNETGLSTLLSGQAGIEHCLRREVIPNIDIITSGPLPPSPSELFQSELMAQLLAALGKAYSQIIIDSPPILPVADPLILGNLADGMVLVVAAAKLPLHALQQAVDKLTKSDLNLLGVIFNQTMKLRSDYYYGGYKHKYYYRYDYYEEGQKSRRS
ncbi:MAG: polysaccharide biosynthesis tyrosine autokinase [Proteobacteria bacterium]|nr:polysaccharide biosynthesis tyrosine autokinase [Pseudomonadota bacterium]MBU4576324.1 polysaccharide biosynthesis tyrosine autokinase [Pseudomonadota bacterium]MBU4599625.1 polysaccharide biosynthesis tyrosine autokinase [Pseudomonadota bacterium]MBV1716121.1 polysaccharide biosynthesis tyrosine autokinase [Desulfarculus sp.]MBV1753442.1 polysaccharide biosynthesis tyrosine autokinase [Desulfarculus sp.]